MRDRKTWMWTFIVTFAIIAYIALCTAVPEVLAVTLMLFFMASVLVMVYQLVDIVRNQR